MRMCRLNLDIKVHHWPILGVEQPTVHQLHQLPERFWQLTSVEDFGVLWGSSKDGYTDKDSIINMSAVSSSTATSLSRSLWNHLHWLGKTRGIQSTLFTQLEDFDYAVGLPVLSTNHTHLEENTDLNIFNTSRTNHCWWKLPWLCQGVYVPLKCPQQGYCTQQGHQYKTQKSS